MEFGFYQTASQFETAHSTAVKRAGWVARQCNGYSIGLAISRSRVQILLEATLRNNLGQVVDTYVAVPLSPCSITWYRPKGGDALRLGRKPQAWRKVMAAYHRVDDLRSPAG